jgi:drug/metabolite transporter (DMT)-like permease
MAEIAASHVEQKALPGQGDRVLAAAGCVLLAMVTLGFIDNCVRVIATEAGLWQFHLIRTLMALPILALAAVWLGQRFRPLRPARVAARSLFNSAAMVLYFGALAFLPIGQVVAGLFTAPIFVLLISALVYGERIGPARIGAVAVAFTGILLVIGFDPARISVMTLVPVLAGFFYAVGNIATRRWCQGESAVTLTSGFFLFMGIWGILGLAALTVWPAVVPDGAAGFLTRGWVAPTGSFLFWTAVQAVGSIVGVGLVIRGYQLAEASYVAIFEYSLLLFAVLWALVLWGEVVGLREMAGMAAIAGAGAIIALRVR